MQQENNWREMVPAVVATAGTIFHENGLASIVLPRYKNRWMIKLFVNEKRKNEIRLDLDELGTAVWQQINGENSVQNILNNLHEIGETEFQFEERVIQFLSNLYRDKIITLRYL